MDLWSAGVVLFAMLYGNVPFKGADMKELHKQILDADYQLKDEISQGKNELSIDCDRCLKLNQGSANEEPKKSFDSKLGSFSSLAGKG